jgi:flavorubredoxin
MQGLIVYHTISGHTRRAAEDIAEGLRSEGVSACLRAAAEMSEWDLAGQAIVVVGSPCHAGSLSIRAGLSGPIRSALKKLPASALMGKVGGAFSVHSAYGGAKTVRAIEKCLRAAGADVPHPGVVVKAGVPFSLVTGPLASEESRVALRALGISMAKAAMEKA